MKIKNVFGENLDVLIEGDHNFTKKEDRLNLFENIGNFYYKKTAV